MMSGTRFAGFLPPKGNKARALAIFFLCLAPLAFGVLAVGLGQDANWDLRNYHYYNAYAFLNDRYAMDLLPSQTPFFYNPLMDVPFFWMVNAVPAKTVGFVLGAVQSLNFILLFAIAHAVLVIANARHKVFVCAALAGLGVLGGGGIAQLGTTFGDNVISIGILFSAALIVLFRERLTSGSVVRSLCLSAICGVFAGMMVGLKLPSIVYSMGLCLGLLFIGKDRGRNFKLGFAFGVGVLIGMAITLGHWAIFLNDRFGSPLFPYFNNVFLSPFAPPVSSRDVQFVPRDWGDFFLMPFLFAQSPHRVGEIEWRDWRLPILYVLLPLAAIVRIAFGRNRNAPDAMTSHYGARFLLIAFAASYFVWLWMFSIYRYAVTLEMVAPLLIVIAMGMLPLKVATRGLITAFILVVVAMSIKPGNWHRREAWLDRFVKAEIPDLGDTSKLMILMAGIEPYSHVIPEFPADISFVRIQSNFSSPEQDKGINTLIRQRIEAHRSNEGAFMILVPEWQTKEVDEPLSHFGLKSKPKNCLTVVDRLFDDTKLSLCPVFSR